MWPPSIHVLNTTPVHTVQSAESFKIVSSESRTMTSWHLEAGCLQNKQPCVAPRALHGGLTWSEQNSTVHSTLKSVRSLLRRLLYGVICPEWGIWLLMRPRYSCWLLVPSESKCCHVDQHKSLHLLYLLTVSWGLTWVTGVRSEFLCYGLTPWSPAKGRWSKQHQVNFLL